MRNFIRAFFRRVRTIPKKVSVLGLPHGESMRCKLLLGTCRVAPCSSNPMVALQEPEAYPSRDAMERTKATGLMKGELCVSPESPTSVNGPVRELRTMHRKYVKRAKREIAEYLRS